VQVIGLFCFGWEGGNRVILVCEARRNFSAALIEKEIMAFL